MLKRFGAVIRQHPFLSIVVLLQMGLIVYLNLFCLDHYLGYDCSSYYLQAIEIWRQKTLMLSNWDYQTTLYTDSPVPFAALLYGLLGNISVAYGLTVVIFSALFVALFVCTAGLLGLPLRAKMIAVILLLTPYTMMREVNNDLGYFRMMFFAHGAYVVKVLILFMVWICAIKCGNWDKKWSSIVARILSLCLCVLTGMSSGLYLFVFGIAPAAAFFMIRAIREDTRAQTNWRPMLYLAACTLCEAAGLVFSKKVMHFTSKDLTTVWTGLTQFWDNLFSIFGGYLKLTGGLPIAEQVPVFSRGGIPYAFSFVLSVFLLFAGTMGAIKSIRSGVNSFFAFVCAFDVLIFIPIFTTYGLLIFEERYLIPSFVGLILFAALWVESNLSCKNKSWRIVLCCALAVCIFAINLNSYIHIYASQNQYAEMEEIKIAAQEFDSDLVYVAGGQIGILARNIRVYDDSRVYKYTENLLNPHHWGDYTYYDDAYGYDGTTMLVTTDDFYNTAVPDYLKRQFEFRKTIGESILVFVASGSNPIDFTTGPLGENSKDYMYSAGIISGEGTLFEENGALNTNGVSGFVTWGPYINIASGTYDFILNYKVVESAENGKIGTFDVAINMQSIQVKEIDANQTQITISDVNLTENPGQLEYRVYLEEGAQLLLESYEFVKKN